MKIQTAKLNYLKIAPRKVRAVANTLKGLTVSEAEAQLLIGDRRSSEPLLKLLRSAVSNAKNQKFNADKLFIKEIRVDGGPMLKRQFPRSLGRADMIQKKSSHITLNLAESEKIKPSRFNIVKPEKISKKKLERIKAEKERDKPKIPEKEAPKISRPREKGFMRKIFRRKNV